MINSDKLRIFYNVSAILCSTLILSSLAFYNGYPFVFNSDTAMYIQAAFRGIVGPDRPILYGLFILVSGFKQTLWGAVIVQSLITSSILFYYFLYFGKGFNGETLRYFRVYFIAFALLITLFMGGGFTASWLMPDIFTPISLLCIGLLLFCRLKKIDKVVISGLTILAVAMHNSTPYICLALIIMILLFFGFKYTRPIFLKTNVTIKKCLIILLLIVVSQLFLAVVHNHYGGGFRPSRGGGMFLMGSFVEMGIAKKYLDDNCSKKQYSICKYKDSLPSNFLWNKQSPIYKNGGWLESEKEYNKIVREIITTPKYLKLVLIGSLNVTIKQFFHYGTGEAYFPSPRVRNVLSIDYGQEYDAFMHSKQYRRSLDFSGLNNFQAVLFILSLLIYLILFLTPSVTLEFKLLICFIFIGIILNAWFCGTFSGVFHRYQSRVVWLLPLPLFLYMMKVRSFRHKFSKD